MRAFDLVSRHDFLVCPLCEVGRLGRFGGNAARCGSCGCLLPPAISQTLEEIALLPDALGSHACECGHPEMRFLPGGIYRCPACAAEVLPVDDASSPQGLEEGCENCR